MNRLSFTTQTSGYGSDSVVCDRHPQHTVSNINPAHKDLVFRRIVLYIAFVYFVMEKPDARSLSPEAQEQLRKQAIGLRNKKHMSHIDIAEIIGVSEIACRFGAVNTKPTGSPPSKEKRADAGGGAYDLFDTGQSHSTSRFNASMNQEDRRDSERIRSAGALRPLSGDFVPPIEPQRPEKLHKDLLINKGCICNEDFVYCRAWNRTSTYA